jgi:alpha-mannosidase
LWSGGEKEDRAWRKPDGSPVTGQSNDGGLLLDIGCLGPYSLAVLTTDSEHPDIDGTESTTRGMAAPRATTSTLENNYLLVEFSKEGDITRIYDKEAGREVVPSNELANQLQLFEDRPKTPDAWEIEIYYDDNMWLAEPAESIRVVENGPLRAAVEIRRHVSHSTLVQRISLAHNSPRLDFDTVIHWHEKHMLLKVAFPVAILSPTATYEIQWGNVQRPTHRNTSWDWARFETCAHKWVDLSEGGYGVSLLNDCKYGHDIHENVIRLTLLRATTDPDPEADQGEHHFVYSLLPHEGSWGELTMAEAYMLNDPVIVYEPNPSSEASTHSKMIADLIQRPFITVDMPNVIVETIKGAEDGNGIIVRLYESQRRRGPVTLATAFPLADAWQTNLIEENQEQLAIEDNQLHITIKPYQIMTLRLLSEDKRSS